jgi:hypothetical protein
LFTWPMNYIKTWPVRAASGRGSSARTPLFTPAISTIAAAAVSF